MKIYFDSSSYAKRFIEETGSQEIDDLCQKATEVGLSIICYPEILSTLNRRLREKAINKNEYKLAKNRFSEEWRDVEIINITPEVIVKTESLLEKECVARIGCFARRMRYRMANRPFCLI